MTTTSLIEQNRERRITGRLTLLEQRLDDADPAIRQLFAEIFDYAAFDLRHPIDARNHYGRAAYSRARAEARANSGHNEPTLRATLTLTALALELVDRRILNGASRPDIDACAATFDQIAQLADTERSGPT